MKPTTFADPGYGDPNAPIGSPEWAKSWRLSLQSNVKTLSLYPQVCAEFYAMGKDHRAWTLVTDEHGNYFKAWEQFCSHRQPWGLGTDPAEFKKFVAPVLGEKAFDLLTVAPGSQGERTDLEETSGNGCPKSSSGGAADASERKRKNLRAILRAPELVQDLYRENLIPQTLAAKLGPASPTPEQAARIAETRQELERVDRSAKPSEVRKRVKEIVQAKLDLKPPTAIEQLQKFWRKATDEERRAFARGDAGDEVVRLRES